MPKVLWIPIGLIVVGTLLGAIVGARSRSSSFRSGALIGFCLATMASFPLMAIGLATS